MKKYFIIIIFLIPLCLFSQYYNVGVGVIIGSPTGLSGKYFLSRRAAIAINAGWSFWPDAGIHLTIDNQFLFPGVIAGEHGKPLENVVPYLGIGGRFRAKEKDDDDTDFHIGIRFGGGIEYHVSQFGIFLELYPVVDILPGTEFDFEGGLGGRIYF